MNESMPSPAPGAAWHRVLAVVIALAAAVSSFAVTTGVAPTDAAWVVTRTMNVSATAVTPVPPTGLACTAGGIGGNVTFTWTAATGIAPSGYTLKWSGGSVSSATTTALVPAPFLGSRVVSVYTDYGSSWQSIAGTQTRTINSLSGIWSCG
jgi:hypothetical protein